ncbi:MAG: hypothetical protein ACLP5H_23250 [Desulfomonilaceae bacterium]
MFYNHADRIGNEGDVPKHAVLAGFVAKIIEMSHEKPFTQDKPFIYVESHTGRALYQNLPKNGRWVNGIGPFSERIIRDSVSYPHLRAYKDACFQSKILEGSDYHGSSGMVFKMLREAGIPFKFYLWDYDSAVCQSLLGFYENWPQVRVCRGDGCEGVTMISDATLALIDPVWINEKERNSILNTLHHLGDNKMPFICWTALVDRQETDAKAFRTATKTDFSIHRVTWMPQPGTSTKGCQITVPKKEPWGSLAGKILRDVRDLMTWGG